MFGIKETVPVREIMPVANPQAQQVAQAIQQNAGVQNLSGGLVFDVYAIPTSFSFTVSSNAGAGATKTVYAFNNDVLNAAVTNNDSGANSIVNTYGDGFSGRVYNQYLKSANGGRGILIKGFTAIATNFTTGLQIATPLTALGFNIIAANGQGSVMPFPVDLAEALRNTQQQLGMLTIVKPFYFNSLMQLQMLLPINTIINFTFFTESSSFAG